MPLPPAEKRDFGISSIESTEQTVVYKHSAALRWQRLAGAHFHQALRRGRVDVTGSCIELDLPKGHDCQVKEGAAPLWHRLCPQHLPPGPESRPLPGGSPGQGWGRPSLTTVHSCVNGPSAGQLGH